MKLKPEIQRKVLKSEVLTKDDSKLIVEHFISTDCQDDGGDIMVPEGMRQRGRVVVLLQHGMDAKSGNEPIAKPLGIRIGTHPNGSKGLIATTQYYDGSHLNPPDNTGRRLYEKNIGGFMPNWSIGWTPIKARPVGNGRIVEEWELHEYSQVAVGMNREAETPEVKEFVNRLPGFKVQSLDEWIPANTDPYTEAKPYPNEHACRLVEPVAGAETRRSNGEREHEGKKYDVIYQKQDGKWVEQAYRYPKEKWTVPQAKSHCKAHEGILFEAASGKAICLYCNNKALRDRIKGDIPWLAIQRIFSAAMSEMVNLSYTAQGEQPMTPEEIASELSGEVSELIAPFIAQFVIEVRTQVEKAPDQPSETVEAAKAFIKNFETFLHANREAAVKQEPTEPQPAPAVVPVPAEPGPDEIEVFPPAQDTQEIVIEDATPASPPPPKAELEAEIDIIDEQPQTVPIDAKDLAALVGEAIGAEVRRAAGRLD